MVSSTAQLNPNTLNNFQLIIDNLLFEKTPANTPTSKQAQSNFNQPSFYVIATLIVGIVSTIFYYKSNIKVAVGFAALSLATLFYGYYKTPSKVTLSPEEEKRPIESIFDDCFKALQTETHYKQQSFLKVFSKLPEEIDEDSLREVLKLYGIFYDSGKQLKDLNDKMFNLGLLYERNAEIPSNPTISMENYRKLSGLAQRFLALDILKFKQFSKADNLLNLQRKCVLLIRGHFDKDNTQNDPFVKVDKSAEGLTIQPWVQVDLPT